MIYKTSYKHNDEIIFDYYILNGRGIEIIGVGVDVEETKDSSGNITSLVFNGFELKQNSYFKANITTNLIGVDNFITRYKIDTIVKRNVNYLIYCSKRTTASYFMLPFVFDSIVDTSYKDYFINCYVIDVEKPKYYKGYLSVLYRFLPFTTYYELEKSFTLNKHYVDLYDPDRDTIMAVFKIPKHYLKDYKLLQEGKFSQIQKTTKDRILRFYNMKKTDMIGQVLYKNTKLKKQIELNLDCALPESVELFEKPNPKIEWFRYE